KTWAGQQKVVRIARAMHAMLGNPALTPETLLNTPAVLFDPQKPKDTVEPFYLDARRAAQANSIDLGFSPDAQGMMMPVYAAVEFLCLVGLQRFRPAAGEGRTFLYHTWPVPLPPAAAAPAAAGAAAVPGADRYSLRLLFRTKYLKGFLPATRSKVTDESRARAVRVVAGRGRRRGGPGDPPVPAIRRGAGRGGVPADVRRRGGGGEGRLQHRPLHRDVRGEGRLPGTRGGEAGDGRPSRRGRERLSRQQCRGRGQPG